MNPLHPDPQSIAIHSAQSDYYKFRTPYIPRLFENLCRELGVTRDTVLMDLGCGRGEVANLLAPYAKKVYAVDGSQEMIDLATKADNVEYQVVDLNARNPSLPAKADHLVFGRSVHWFPSASLKRFASDLLADGGRIVVCSTQWSPVGEWGRVYLETKQRFAPERGSAPVAAGKTHLADAGFAPVKRIAIEANMKASVDFMVGHAFSTTYRDDLAHLERRAGEFAKAMRESLEPFERREQIALKIRSWAVIHGRSADVPATRD